MKKVVSFYQRLVNDLSFRDRLRDAGNAHEHQKTVQEAGYEFTQEEFEAATVEILENDKLMAPGSVLTGLTADDLALAFGGSRSGTSQPGRIFDPSIVQAYGGPHLFDPFQQRPLPQESKKRFRGKQNRKS